MDGEYHPPLGDRLRRYTRRHLLERLRSMVAPAGTRLLDLGGGTGVTTVEFGDGAREVYVLEPDARKCERGLRAGAPVTFVSGVAEAIPFGEGRFDRVVSLMSFHHFSDGDRACREAARVLAPGGRFVVYDIHRSSLAARWLSCFARHRGHSASGFTTAEELAQKLGNAGFHAVRQEPYRSGTFVIGER
jgi:demethylmenaquinone methyltransferase/2-methoxy-6-polyprenyl-1,4-benzoquinol methylase